MIGALNWHFPKRAWDARLRLTCNKFMAIDYHKQAQGIIDNLKISPSADGMTFDLSTETIDQELVINSITLRRTTIHSTTDIVPGLELHLTESQDLAVQAPGPKSLYRGSTATPKAMNKESTRYWYVYSDLLTNAVSLESTDIFREQGLLLASYH